MIQCRLLGLVFLFFAIHGVLLGFVFESGYDLLCCQDSRVSETRKKYFVDLVYCSEYRGQVSNQIWVTFRNHTENCHVYWFDKLGLLRNDYGEFGNLCVFVDCIK